MLIFELLQSDVYIVVRVCFFIQLAVFRLLVFFLITVNIKFCDLDGFLEQPSSGMLKVKRLESQII